MSKLSRITSHKIFHILIFRFVYHILNLYCIRITSLHYFFALYLYIISLHYLFVLFLYIIFLYYLFTLLLSWIKICNRSLSTFYKKRNYFNNLSTLLHRIILQVNSNGSLIFFFKIKEFVNKKLFTLFARISLYFVFDSMVNVFNIIYLINDSFMIDESNLCKRKYTRQNSNKI